LKTEKETWLRATPLMARQNLRGFVGPPVAGYLTWQGQMLENNGIVPMFCIELSRSLAGTKRFAAGEGNRRGETL
jgi:hypothetical protein